MGGWRAGNSLNWHSILSAVVPNRQLLSVTPRSLIGETEYRLTSGLECQNLHLHFRLCEGWAETTLRHPSSFP